VGDDEYFCSYKDKWRPVAEASQYWAGMCQEVLESKLVDGTPSWNVPDPEDEARWSRIDKSENAGVLFKGAPGTHDITSLGTPLGVESKLIEDARITAKSEWDSPGWPARECAASLARLNRKDGMGGCWIAGSCEEEWLEVDLGSLCSVTGVATQGRGQTRDGAYEQWVAGYEVETKKSSADKDGWVRQGDLFKGNSDSGTAVGHKFETAVQCRLVRFKPKAWFEHISMRVEVYGERIEPYEPLTAAQPVLEPPAPPVADAVVQGTVVASVEPEQVPESQADKA